MVVHGQSCGVNISGRLSGVSGGSEVGRFQAFQTQHIPVPLWSHATQNLSWKNATPVDTHWAIIIPPPNQALADPSLPLYSALSLSLSGPYHHTSLSWIGSKKRKTGTQR